MTAEKVVMNLGSVISYKTCLVAVDNFSTTNSLLRGLLEKGTYAMATLRSDREGLPDLMQKKKQRFEKGEFMFGVKWMDNNLVCFLSNYCSPKSTCPVLRKSKYGSTLEVSCPEVVSKYNEIMDGVARFDQLRECYEIERRSTKWWPRLFCCFLLDMAIINAYILIKDDEHHQKRHS
ncbi:hypothetical protein JTB14_002808 [Gonioctena quinquepunctata]|nr:hypothetical protein JTB14_002808 [Gonioctena quinquepunctata]